MNYLENGAKYNNRQNWKVCWLHRTTHNTKQRVNVILMLYYAYLLSLVQTLQPYGLQPTRLLCPWRFSRQKYWSGLPFPSPGDLPNPGIEPRSPALQVDSLPSKPLGKPKNHRRENILGRKEGKELLNFGSEVRKDISYILIWKTQNDLRNNQLWPVGVSRKWPEHENWLQGFSKQI